MGGIDSRFTFAKLETVRAMIAKRVLDETENSSTLGSISLKPHQLSAIHRIESAIAQFGGAILCDPVGTGKTFTALATMRKSEPVLVVAPAVLRDMWLSASADAGRRIRFVSYEALSRRNAPALNFDFAVLDEAHHVRNPLTARYEELARLVSRSSVLMLTATPIHNRRRDLVALLQIVMGDRAYRLSDADLSQCVIRRDDLARTLEIPEKLDMIWHRLSASDAIPRRILSLPPPLPPRDGGDGGALVAHSLVRQWASSDAALRGALRRRLVRASALISALEDGTWPTRSELAQWISGEDSVQLAFTGFLASHAAADARLRDVVKAHRDGIVELLAILDAASSLDNERARIIDEIRKDHRSERIVVFSAYSDTIDSMFKRLAPAGGTAALTSSGGRVAGGRVSRAHAVAQFSPASDTKVNSAEEITLLLTTDLLSEGVNLQNASVVIHLDLPWTPARLEQRLGRIARIGSPHSRVVSHAFRPSAGAELLIHIEEILRTKSLQVISESDARRDHERLRDVLAAWKRAVSPMPTPIVAAVRAALAGFVALIDGPAGLRLIASTGDDIAESPASVLSILEQCLGRDACADEVTVLNQLNRIIEWADSTSALDDIEERDTSARKLVLDRVAHLGQSARPHERARVALLSSEVRERMRARLSHYDETRLRNHVSCFEERVEWLEGLLAILTSHNAHQQRRPAKIIAMIIAAREMR